MDSEYFKRRATQRPVDYGEAYWGTVIDPDGNARDRRAEREQHLDDIKQELTFLNGLSPGRILDVGCGLGFLLSGLVAGWEKHGVEVSTFAAKFAQEFAAVHRGTLADARYPDEYFDVVVIHHVIEHLEDPVGVALETYRILRPGGTLLLATPDFESGCARRFGDKYRLLHDPTHISLFSSDSMHRFLRDHGFIIERVEYPFFETRHFTSQNLMRLFDTNTISPPFYGNFMTFYARKPQLGRFHLSALELSRLARRVADQLEAEVTRAGKLVGDSLLRGQRVLACGSAGSTDHARHFVAELIGRMAVEKRRPPAIALTTDPSVESTGDVFARQVEGLGKPEDVLIAISTDGRSADILRAVEAAHRGGLQTVALLGEQGDPALEQCAVTLHIHSTNTQRVQEMHLAVLHAISDEASQAILRQQ